MYLIAEVVVPPDIAIGCFIYQDDGFILYESRAICRYIEAKYPNQGISLVPTGLQPNALFEQAASIEQSDFDPPASGIVFETIFKKYDIIYEEILVQN
jgi:glutathione S-transferase